MHPDFELLGTSWALAVEADGYSANTLRTYRKGVANLAAWLADHHPGVGPVELERGHVRGWLVDVRRTRSASTAHSWFSGVRHFCRWLVEEGEAAGDATAGVKTPRPEEPSTQVLGERELRRLLKTTEGTDFASRRDQAILLLFLDGGLRLAELAGLRLGDVDLPDRIVYVAGKGSRRSGPRYRAIPLGARSTRALDRYVRARRRHPLADRPELWLGSRGRTMGAEGIGAIVKRRADQAGLKGVHPHALRHSWRPRSARPAGARGICSCWAAGGRERNWTGTERRRRPSGRPRRPGGTRWGIACRSNTHSTVAVSFRRPIWDGTRPARAGQQDRMMREGRAPPT